MDRDDKIALIAFLIVVLNPITIVGGYVFGAVGFVLGYFFNHAFAIWTASHQSGWNNVVKKFNEDPPIL